MSIKRLDLTECGITCLENLQYFPHLETLVLDRNRLVDLTAVRCPPLPHLTTLWCNNNDINHLPTFLGMSSTHLAPSHLRHYPLLVVVLLCSWTFMYFVL